ncbi:MAG TPA: hypothetical protein VE871_01785 [Longimicrobium sp.]|nr:hypothetical protein [Longimicrobium sp.]
MHRPDPATSAPLPELAESVRHAIIEAGEAAYEDAGIQGLCAEGRWEAAVAAMRAADLGHIVRGAAGDDPHPSPTDGTAPFRV